MSNLGEEEEGCYFLAKEVGWEQLELQNIPNCERQLHFQDSYCRQAVSKR